METYQFERLSAWQKAKELAIDVYRLVAKFPQFEQYALSSQLRRSVISLQTIMELREMIIMNIPWSPHF